MEKAQRSVTVAKMAALMLSVAVCILSLFPVPQWALVYEGCPIIGRMFYSFFHANVFHALVNVWTLLAVVFLSRVSVWALAASYAAAVCLPWGLSVPTCGMSVMVFFLLGSVSYFVRRPIRYDIPVLTFILLGVLLPHVNAMAHIYAYTVGWVYGFLFDTHDGQ